MGYRPLVDFHHIHLTKWFPITPSAIYILHRLTLGQSVVRCCHLCCSTPQYSATMAIENIKILGAILELPAKLAVLFSW